MAIDRFADDVPEEIKRQRNNELLALQGKVCAENNREMIGRTVEVLVEGQSKLVSRQTPAAGAVELGWERSRNRQLRGDHGGIDSYGGVAESATGRVGGDGEHRSLLDCSARGVGSVRSGSAARGSTATGAGARARQKDRPDGLRVDSAAAQLRIAAGFVSTGGIGLHAADAGAGQGQPGCKRAWTR